MKRLSQRALKKNVCCGGPKRHMNTTIPRMRHLALEKGSDSLSHLGGAHQIPVVQSLEVCVLGAVQSSDGRTSFLDELVT